MEKISPDKAVSQRDEGGVLFVGVDIGSAHHAAAVIDPSGKVLERLPRIYNTLAGFRYLEKKIDYWAAKMKTGTVRLGFEPTGHYWKPLAHFLVQNGIQVFFIKTTAVKAMRELTDSTPSKNDKRDAVTLAHLLREGKCLKSPPPEGVWRELRELARCRQRVSEGYNALLQRLKAIIETFFPELLPHFSSLEGVGLRKLLAEAPFPEDLLNKEVDWLAVNLGKWTRRKKKAREKAEKIVRAATESAGMPPLPGDRARLGSVLRLLELYKTELKLIEEEMAMVLDRTGYAEILLSVPGIGVVSAATLLGELGNPENFENASQWVSMAGIDPSEKSSGKRESRRRISKKGRPLLRTNLFFMALTAIQHCPELRSYYLRRKGDIESGRLDIVPKQLVFAVAIKELRILFAMCRDKTAYNPSSVELRKAA